MSCTRNLLHKSKMEAFAQWAETQGWLRESIPPKAAYQVLRLYKNGQRLVYYARQKPTDHITCTTGPELDLVVRFIRESKDHG